MNTSIVNQLQPTPQNIFGEDIIRKNALEFFNGETLSAAVWMEKYALKNKAGEFLELTPLETVDRASKEINRIEDQYKGKKTYVSQQDVQNIIGDLNKFIFGGSILFGIGNNFSYSTMGNCFFVWNGIDSYAGIVNTDEQCAQIMKRRGGVGITIDHYRPKGANVNNSANTSSGAISFMNRFSTTTGEVAQDGRRGALMITMSIRHIESLEFISAKEEDRKIEYANISLKVDDDFMNRVKAYKETGEDLDYITMFPIPDDKVEMFRALSEAENVSVGYNERFYVGEYTFRKLKVSELWNKLCHFAWKTAEPGVLFWDTVLNNSLPDCYAHRGIITRGTNPCGEIPLFDKGKCLLASHNLLRYVINPFTPNAEFDWIDFDVNVYNAAIIMDDVTTLEIERTERIIEKIESDPNPPYIKQVELDLWNGIQRNNISLRQVGVGYMGLGDALAALGIVYGSQEAIDFSTRLQSKMAVTSMKANIDMAEDRGPFEYFEFDKECNNKYIKDVFEVMKKECDVCDYDYYVNKYAKFGRRNVTQLSLAPTGSLSILARVSSGMEPVFKCAYRRRKKVNISIPEDVIAKKLNVWVEDGVVKATKDLDGIWWEEYNVVHPTFKMWYDTTRKESDVPMMDIEDMDEDSLCELVNNSPYAGSESHTIDTLGKVHMQGAIQQFCDNSISVTHNIPKEATEEDVSDLYLTAFLRGCKGATIYRDGSRTGILISRASKPENEFKETKAPKRPKVMDSDYYNVTSRGRKFGIIVGLMNGSPYEIFAVESPDSKFVNGKCTITKVQKKMKKQYTLEQNGNIMEKLQLSNTNKEEMYNTIYISMLLRHGAPVKHIIKTIEKVDDNIVSFSSAVRRILSKYVPEEDTFEKCPKCGGRLLKIEGCVKCENSLGSGPDSCIYSKC